MSEENNNQGKTYKHVHVMSIRNVYEIHYTPTCMHTVPNIMMVYHEQLVHVDRVTHIKTHKKPSFRDIFCIVLTNLPPIPLIALTLFIE